MIPEREQPYTSGGGSQFDHLQYWRDADWEHPPPPRDPAYWCAIHRRPLTWRESIYAGEGPRCSWCRDPLTAPPSELRDK